VRFSKRFCIFVIVGLIESIPALLLGTALIYFARQIARLPREWRWVRLRRTPGFFESDRGVLVLTYFWRFCGTLWVVSGITLAAGLASPIRFPQ
jgi:hypothetical protein